MEEGAEIDPRSTTRKTRIASSLDLLSPQWRRAQRSTLGGNTRAPGRPHIPPCAAMEEGARSDPRSGLIVACQPLIPVLMPPQWRRAQRSTLGDGLRRYRSFTACRIQAAMEEGAEIDPRSADGLRPRTGNLTEQAAMEEGAEIDPRSEGLHPHDRTQQQQQPPQWRRAQRSTLGAGERSHLGSSSQAVMAAMEEGAEIDPRRRSCPHHAVVDPRFGGRNGGGRRDRPSEVLTYCLATWARL